MATAITKGSARLAGAAGILEGVFGMPELLGILTSADGTVITNATTAVPFTIPAGARLVLQTDVACYVVGTPDALGVAVVATTGATGNGYYIEVVGAGLDKLSNTICLHSYMTGLSAVGGGAFNLKVFSLN